MGLRRRVFAASYDRFTAGAERNGLAAARHELLSRVQGRVLEIGAGTGRNIDHYPPGHGVTFTEPDPYMAKRLHARGVEVVEAGAEALPFDDGSFATVVSTLVLCTVPDVPATLHELRRVLAPGGRLLFLEHVRAEEGSRTQRWQDRLHGPWHALACGCNCNRDLLATLAVASFTIHDLRRENWRFMPAIVRPVIAGVASPNL